jgi:spoIIIJ-associated protein
MPGEPSSTPIRSNQPPTHSTAISRAIQSSVPLPQPLAPRDLDDEEPVLDDESETFELSSVTQEIAGEEAPDAVVHQALEILRTLLQEMQFPTNVEIASRNPLVLNIRVGGQTDILGLLIGKRGDTLASLQLLVNLILNRPGGTRYHVLVDAEHYRGRRDENLRSLAARVARQVQQSRRAMALEPMTPYERRIVHMALQDSPFVQTQSTGEGDQRRVVISLKPPSR